MLCFRKMFLRQCVLVGGIDRRKHTCGFIFNSIIFLLPFQYYNDWHQILFCVCLWAQLLHLLVSLYKFSYLEKRESMKIWFLSYNLSEFFPRIAMLILLPILFIFMGVTYFTGYLYSYLWARVVENQIVKTTRFLWLFPWEI